MDDQHALFEEASPPPTAFAVGLVYTFRRSWRSLPLGCRTPSAFIGFAPRGFVV